MEGNLASVHLKECVSGLSPNSSGNVGLKGEKREREGVLWVRLVHSENREELREFARKKERKKKRG